MKKLHKDGLARDLKRWQLEWRVLRAALKPELKRFKILKPWKWFHLTTNLYVESSRYAPWLAGHVSYLQSWVITILATALAYLIWCPHA